MSKTVGCTFLGRNIWVYDTALAAWLVALIDQVEADPDLRERFGALVDAARRTAALGGDSVFDPEDHLDPGDVRAFVDLAGAVSGSIMAAGPIDWERLAKRQVLDDMRPAIRLGHVPSLADVASVGEAFAGMADDTLPAPPDGTWWAIGFPRGRTTIRMVAKAPRG